MMETAKNMKYIIQTIAPYSFRYDESMSKTKDRCTKFYYSMYKNVHNNSRIQEDIKEYEFERYRFDRLFCGMLKWEDISRLMWEQYWNSGKGKDMFNEKEIFNAEKVSEEEKYHIKRQYDKPYPETICENIEIIKQMYGNVRKDVKILFFMPPFTDYYKQYWNEEYYFETRKILNGIAEEVHADILDMTKMHLDDDLFRDSGHLNKWGAAVVSEKINEWIGI